MDEKNDIKEEIQTLEWGEESPSSDFAGSASTEPLDEKDKLKLASGVLIVLAILFLAGMIIRILFTAEAGTDVFEACKTILPPIATLVLGYYFGKN